MKKTFLTRDPSIPLIKQVYQLAITENLSDPVPQFYRVAVYFGATHAEATKMDTKLENDYLAGRVRKYLVW